MNSFCLEKMVKPADYQQRGRKKRDMLSFRIELAIELVGYFLHGNVQLDDLDHLSMFNLIGSNWPIHTSSKGRCVVCLETIRKKSLPTIGHRHDSSIQCEYCKVPLCVATERNCFKKYHTLVTFS